MRPIAVFTSSRADLGPLGPVIGALDARDDVALHVIATGTHLTSEFGGRPQDIRLSTGNRVHLIDAGMRGTNPVDLGKSFGRIAAGVSRLLASEEIKVLVLLGDRWELLAASGAALVHGVTIAHVHGGETTEGAIDERVRHGVTKLADLHLCATEDSARRIRRLGEEARRIIVTGAPGLDRLRNVRPLTATELEHRFGMPVLRPFGVVVYHPPTVDRDAVACRARQVLDAAAAELGSVLVLYPGADPGTAGVVTEIQSAVVRHENVAAKRNLGNDYLDVLAAADVLIGNSSSGIIEAASLRLPVVDVGDRQAGRCRPRNVIHVDSGTDAIATTIRQAISARSCAGLTDLQNPYGDGHAGERIAQTVATFTLSGLARKPLVSVQDSDISLVELVIPPEATLRSALAAIDRGRQQIALVVDDGGRLVGTVSDGDVRRALLTGHSLESAVDEHTNRVPVVCTTADGPRELLELMERHSVSQVPVLSEQGTLVGLRTMREISSALLGDDSANDTESLHYNDACVV